MPGRSAQDTQRVLALMRELTERARRQSRTGADAAAVPAQASRNRVDDLHGDVEQRVTAARAHANAAVSPPPPTRFRAMKRVVSRVARLVTVPQQIATGSLADAVMSISDEVRALEHGSVAKVVALELGLQDSVTSLEQRLLHLQRSCDRLAEQAESTRRELDDVRRRELSGLAWVHEILGSDFYDDFEARFRGSRQDIAALQAEHLEEARRAADASAPLLDVGSGRGEWLELLQAAGVPAYGVDVSARFAEQCRARGLDVRHADAVEHLSSLADDSIGAVTALHVIEHLTLDAVVALMDEALRALRPGGLLLLETPNPMNVVVGAANFYLDPTHLRPVHPLFLEFLAASRGYVDIELRFLHAEDGHVAEWPDDDERVAALLGRAAQALTGPQDYALLARRPITP